MYSERCPVPESGRSGCPSVRFLKKTGQDRTPSVHPIGQNRTEPDTKPDTKPDRYWTMKKGETVKITELIVCNGFIGRR